MKQFIMFLDKTKNYNRLNMEGVEKHVSNIRDLDESGKLSLCGVFKGYPGVAGMFILNAESKEAAKEICEAEPLVKLGYATYRLAEFEEANKDNNYLL